MPGQYINCPNCGGDIKAIAVKCKHCKAHLTGEDKGSDAGLKQVKQEAGVRSRDLSVDAVRQNSKEILKVRGSYCSNCGTGIEGDALYCLNCGGALKRKTGISNISAQKKSKSGRIAILLGALLLAVIVFRVFFVISLPQGEDEYAEVDPAELVFSMNNFWHRSIVEYEGLNM